MQHAILHGDDDEQGIRGSIPSYLVSSVFGSVLVPACLSVLKPWPGEERTAVEGAPSLLSQKVRFPMKCSSLFHVEKTNAPPAVDRGQSFTMDTLWEPGR